MNTRRELTGSLLFRRCMQQFIVSGDQHLKVSKELPLEWQLNRYRALFMSYVDLCKVHDAELILAGDLFHNAKPNMHEVQLFLELMQLLEDEAIYTSIISGNHENLGTAGTTLDYFNSIFEASSYIQYYPEIGYRDEADVSLTFVGHHKLQEWLDQKEDVRMNGTKVVFSHFRPTVNYFIQEEVDVDKFSGKSDLVIAGDIHMDFQLGNVVYTNAPLNNHFESAPECGCILLSLQDGKADWKRIPLVLPNLIQIDTTAEKFEDTLDTFNFYRISVTGTPEDLRQIKTTTENTKLLKIPELQDTYVESEITEEVKNLSLQDALVEYMKELNYTEEKIAEMIGVWHE
jgi:DNA repair exonuclease SbcCD nuclease subunit